MIVVQQFREGANNTRVNDLESSWRKDGFKSTVGKANRIK